MEFARKVWKLLVAIKDGMALLFLLVFFMALYAILTIRPNPGQVQKGALLLQLDGMIVEEPSVPDPVALLLSGQAPLGEYRARDVVRALRLAAKDDRIEVVVLDLSGFIGGGFVHLQDIGDALDEVRAANKPVLVHALAYIDDGMLLAAHASEVWVDPMGGAFITGPGGNNLYYGRLLDKLKIDANVFRVGTFKSAVEPWTRNDPSPASRESYTQLYGAIWDAWKVDYAKARPKAKLDLVTSDPVAWLNASGGDAAEADKAAGLVDRIGNRTEFGIRVAEIAGDARGDTVPGNYAYTDLRTWLAAHPEEHDGTAIAVVTIAGEIVDGDAGPGVAGGERIEILLNEALDDEYAALVVRVDSPGGSVVASEQIRSAIARYKAKNIPVIVSMANVAASGGYWVSTPASRIFAEPGTITGSIGIFAILPSFDRALADLGVTGGGVQTTPLSGQPDVLTGLAPEISQMIQANIENGYNEFTSLVRTSRKGLPPGDDWAQGRPWDGGTARQLGLIDAFGGLDDALAYAAKVAKLEEGDWHADYLGVSDDPLTQLLMSTSRNISAPTFVGGDLAGIAAQRQQTMIASALRQAEWLIGTRGMQAYCLECPKLPVSRDYQQNSGNPLMQLARLLSLTVN